MMLHGAQSPSVTPAPGPPVSTIVNPQHFNPPRRMRRKRKAESQDNERLSKRLSLLNLGMLDSLEGSWPCLTCRLSYEAYTPIEQSGSKLYVPVETLSTDANAPTTHDTPKTKNAIPDDTMQVDDSKHKVYIYNIDDELSSDSESDDGKLVFLPDIEKHLKLNRIPPSILANEDGELAGMQMVLYSDPKSLTVPEEKDSVRKAIIESRHRVREQQRIQREGKWEPTKADEASTREQVMNGVDAATHDYDHDPDMMEMD